MSPILELERTLFGLSPLSRRMAHFFPEIMEHPGVLNAPNAAGWVRVNVWDTPDNVLVVAEVPGLTEKDVQISFDKSVLTLSGERAAAAPEGYTAVRRERPNLRFSRSVRFGVPIDVDNITAVVKNGLLTVTLPKKARPAARSIPVTTVAN
jgi:HSP20 family protein